MSEHVATGSARTTLIDIANCIGCRACQVACKQWNDKDGEQTTMEAELGFQNPATLSAKTYTLIAFHDMENAEAPGGVESAFVMQRCLHCLEPGCVSACPTTALQRQAEQCQRLQQPRQRLQHALLPQLQPDAAQARHQQQQSQLLLQCQR